MEKLLKATIAHAKEIAQGTYEVRFDLETKDFEFQAGQYVWVNLPKLFFPDPKGSRRAFSIASSPNTKGSLEIIFRDSGSGFKRTLIDKKSLGSKVEIIGPFGFLGLPEGTESNLIFVAGGVGVAPFVSMIRYASESKLQKKITLIFANSDIKNSFYVGLFEDLEKQNQNFKFVSVYGRLTASTLKEKIGEIKNNHYFVTGSRGFVVNASSVLRSLGVPLKNFIFDEFYGVPPESPLEEAAAAEVETEVTLKEFRTAVMDVADHIVMTDVDGFIRYANPAAEKITGYTFSEMKGNTPRLWGGLMGKEFYEKMWRTIKIEKKVFESELTNRRKNGEMYYAIARISPILNEKGNLTGFVATEEDITKIKELDRLKDEFLSMASHELRTPLTAIDGIVAMIKEGDYGTISKKVSLALDDVGEASNRMIKLVNDLLSLSRIQAGRLKYNLSTFDIMVPVRNVYDLFRPVIQEKGLKIELTGQVSALVQADQDKVEQVLTNLLSNCLKFTQQGGISIKVAETKDQVEVFVADTGIGISRQDQRLLFGKFQQIRAGKEKAPGTGLGLFISREMIRKMGGEIWLEESEPGKGSIFAFSLPKDSSMAAKKAVEIIQKESQEHPDQKYDTIKKI